MKLWIGITDGDWYRYLRAQPDLDEVNFWQPSGKRQFRALDPGEPFLFKLHSPDNFIVGGGFFATSSILPSSLAWQIFREKNGAIDFSQMRSRIERYRRAVEGMITHGPSDPARRYSPTSVSRLSPSRSLATSNS